EHLLAARNPIGRHPGQAIQILDRVVSKEHAEIVASPEGGFALVDGGSRNGSYVNGALIQGRQQLKNGDRITLGSTELFYQADDEPTTDSFTQARGGRVTIHADSVQSHIHNKF